MEYVYDIITLTKVEYRVSARELYSNATYISEIGTVKIVN